MWLGSPQTSQGCCFIIHKRAENSSWSLCGTPLVLWPIRGIENLAAQPHEPSAEDDNLKRAWFGQSPRPLWRATRCDDGRMVVPIIKAGKRNFVQHIHEDPTFGLFVDRRRVHGTLELWNFDEKKGLIQSAASYSVSLGNCITVP